MTGKGKENYQLRDFLVAGVKREFFIDSGALRTLLKVSDFKHIVANAPVGSVKWVASETAPKMIAFASKTPLKVVGAFNAEIAPAENPDRKTESDMYAIAGAQINLLSHEVAVKIGVLKVGYDECNYNNSNELTVAKISETDKLEIDYTAEEFPKYPGFQLRLIVKDSAKPRCFWYDIVKPGQEEMYKRELISYLSTKIIEPPAMDEEIVRVSPGMAASKEHGKGVRVVVNFMALNEDLETTNETKMPTCASMTRFTMGRKYFAKIDLSSAFLHIEIHPDDRKHTIFYTRYGLFQCRRMMFGLKTAPQEFQCIMEKLLKDLKANVMVYIDDILMAADSIDELRIIFDKVMELLKSKNFKVNMKKTEFGVEKVEIVGFLASAIGVEITPKRIEVVKNLKVPKNLSELKSLLGFFTFIGHHIPNFGRLAGPLWKLAKQSTKKNFNWEAQHTRALDELKTSSTECRILSHFDNRMKTYVMSDASEYAIGGILFQIDKDEKNWLERIKIVSFASKILPAVFERFHQFEREMFGVVWILNHFREWLKQPGVKCKVLTDLRTAKIIMEKCLKHGGKQEQKRFDRWLLSVYDIDYEILWIPGKMNISDCPSRLSTTISRSKGSDDFDEDYVIDYSDEPKISAEELEELDTPCFICNVVKADQFVTHDEVASESLKDIEIMKAIEDVNAGRPVHAMWKQHKQMLVETGGVLIRGSSIVLPTTLRYRSLLIAHQSHLAAESMVKLLKEFVWWPGMRKDVDLFISKCETCIMIRKKPTAAPMKPTVLPKGPWEKVSMDFADFPVENATILVMVDNFSRFSRFIPVRNKEFLTVSREVDNEIAHYGSMKTLKHDGGPPMNAKVWSEHYQAKGIKVEFSTPDHPQGNGLAERQMQRLNNIMMSSWLNKTSWMENLKIHEKLYNAAPHKSTGVPPFLAMFNRQTEIGLPILPEQMYRSVDWDAMRERDDKAKSYMKKYGDDYVGAKEPEFQEGDLVFVLGPKKNLKLRPIYRLKNDRSPEKWRIASVDKENHKYILKNDDNGTLERDAANIYKCPISAEDKRRNEILHDITSDMPSMSEVAGIPLEIIRTLDSNSSDSVENDDLKEAVDRSIDLHVELETKRTRRVAAERAMEKTKELKKKKLL